MASGYKPRTMERVLFLPMDIGGLCGVLACQAGERGWSGVDRVCAADKAILNYLLYVDTESTVYGKTEEMDASGHVCDFGIVDILSSGDDAK